MSTTLAYAWWLDCINGNVQNRIRRSSTRNAVTPARWPSLTTTPLKSGTMAVIHEAPDVQPTYYNKSKYSKNVHDLSCVAVKRSTESMKFANRRAFSPWFRSSSSMLHFGHGKTSSIHRAHLKSIFNEISKSASVFPLFYKFKRYALHRG